MRQEYTEKLMIILPLVIVTCFAVAYWPALMKLEHQWSAGDNSYCYLIVPLFLYLCWDKRHASHAGNRLEEREEGRGKMDEGRWMREDGRKAGGRAFGCWRFKVRGKRLKPNVAESDLPQTSDLKPNATEGVTPHPSEAVILPPSVQSTGGFRFGEFSWSLWGLVPVVFSVVLIIIGELGSVRALMFIGIWGCVVGVCVMLYGKRTRHLVFPLLILFFIIPLPPFVNQVLTFKLKMAASKLSVWMLRVVGVSVLLEGNIIDIGIDKLEVADACSGLRYLMPMILMALLVAYFFVKGRWRWTVLLLLIVPLSIFINSLRIWISALLTASGHPELARNLFHDFSGWLMFMIAGVILVAVALILKRIGHRFTQTHTDVSSCGPAEGKGVIASRENQNLDNQPNDLTNQPFDDLTNKGQSTNLTNSTKTDDLTNRLKPTLITVILCLIFAGSGWALKQIPSSGNLPQRMSFEHFPMKIGDWHGKREYISQEILNSLWADDYVTARYFKPGSPNMIYLLIPFYNYQVTNHTAHAPQACILGGGFSLTRPKEHKIRVSPEREIKIMTMIMKKGDTRLLGSYFFLQKGRVITSPWMNKFYLIWDGITKQRTDGALVRAEMTVAPGQSMEDAYDELEGFIVKLWPILPNYIPN